MLDFCTNLKFKEDSHSTKVPAKAKVTDLSSQAI